MNRSRTLLVLVLLAATPALASAGFFFGKKTAKPDPAVHVPELLGIVKADGDEDKRAAAAEELRQYETDKFPEIIPVLIDVLQHDSKASVRAEAAQSLGKLRPINQQAGAALEEAVAKDAAMRVRLQARSSLLLYYMAGYRAGKKDEIPTVPGSNKEPPLVGGVPPVINTNNQPPTTPSAPPSTPSAPPSTPSAPPSTAPAPPRLTPIPNPNTTAVPGTPMWTPYSANKPLPPKPATAEPPLAAPRDQGPDLKPPG
jgi:hypothetical protein